MEAAGKLLIFTSARAAWSQSCKGMCLKAAAALFQSKSMDLEVLIRNSLIMNPNASMVRNATWIQPVCYELDAQLNDGIAVW